MNTSGSEHVTDKCVALCSKKIPKKTLNYILIRMCDFAFIH